MARTAHKIPPHSTSARQAGLGGTDARIAKLAARGKKHMERKEWSKAAKYYNEAWNLAPDNKDLLIVVSHLLVQLGVRSKAIGVLEKALEANGPTKEVLAIMGKMALDMKMFDIAEKVFRIYVESFPQDPHGYNSLANALGGQERYDESIQLLHDVIPVFVHSVDLWNTVASHVAMRDGYAASIVFYEEAWRLNPKDFRVASNIARIYDKIDQPEKAIEWAERAVKLDPKDPEPRFGLGLSQLTVGELKKGWRNYAYRRDSRRNAQIVHYTHELPAWDGRNADKKSILIVSEQGVGDEILFGFALPRLHAEAKELYIGCDKRLVPLFQRSFPNATIDRAAGTSRYGYLYRGYPDIEKNLRAGKIKIDCALEMGGLPGLYWQSLDDVPQPAGGYLSLLDDKVEKWHERLAALGDKPKVGIAWRSGTITADRIRNYLTIAELAPLLAVEDIEFINLQYGKCGDELKEARDTLGATIHSWDDLDLKNDFEDIFALMKNLDLVVSTGTAVPMMAAAVGTPAWWMLRRTPWWSLGSGTVPFHPRGHFFKAQVEEPWDGVTDEIARRLRDGAAAGTFEAP